MSILARFGRLHREAPDRALIHVPSERESWTAADIWRAHQAYGSHLRANGLRPGQLLVVATGNRASLVPLFLAARAMDLSVAAVDPGTTAAEIETLAETLEAVAFVVPSEHACAREGSPCEMPGALSLVMHRPTAPPDYADAALLKITSGSTGLPKAARTTDAQLIADSEHIIEGMGIGPDRTQIAAIPLSHAYGASVILLPLLLQGTPIVLRESFVPPQLAGDAAAFNARIFAGVPYMFEHFLANRRAEWPRSLETVISAGSPLAAGTVRSFRETFGTKIHTFYGATECGGIAYDAADTVDGTDTVGSPLPGVTITLLSNDGAPAGSGRVHVRSDAVAGGYVGHANDDFCDGGFLTGDYGAFDAAGRLRLTGRMSSFINVAGKKVQPAEVEQVLRQMPGVRDVRVVAAADPQRGQQVVACLVVDAAQAGAPTMIDVRRFCASRLAPHKIPRAVVLLDALPLTARGKTDRRAIEEIVHARIDGITQ